MLGRLQRGLAKYGLAGSISWGFDRLSGALSMALTRLDCRWNRSTKCVEDDIPYNVPLVYQQLKQVGVTVVDYEIDIQGFHAWLEHSRYPESYCNGYANHFPQKALEHCLSIQWGSLSSQSVVMDIASSSSPFAEIVVDQIGCRVYRCDLAFPPGLRQISDRIGEIGGNAAHLPVPDEFADLMVLHCAFETFEGDNDGDLIVEASRVLKTGGRLIIIPLYMHERYLIYRDPAKDARGVHYDPGAEIIYRPRFVRFCRFYNVQAFMERVVARSQGMSLKVLYAANAWEVDPACKEFHFAAIFEREELT